MHIDELAFEQAGVASSAQLGAAGFSRHQIAHRVQARRWQRFGRVIVMHSGQLSQVQQWWVAVLQHPHPCGLAGITAAAAAGIELRAAKPDIQLLVPRGAHVRAMRKVAVHYSERLDFVSFALMPPRVTNERAIVQAALWERSPKVAGGYLVAAFQQRKLQTKKVAHELAAAGDYRHVRMLQRLVPEITAGAGSLAEVEFARLARAAGLPRPVQQARREGINGRKAFLDFDFGRFSVEVDGPLHWEATSYDETLARARALVRAGDRVLPFSTLAIWSDQQAVISELRATWAHFAGSDPHKRAL